VLIPPAPPVPVAALDPVPVLVPLAPPAPPAPLLELDPLPDDAPLLELDPLLDDALLLELDPLLDDALLLAPPSGMYGGGNEPASVTPQMSGASHTRLVQLALQQSASFAQGIPAMPQWLKACTPAMQMPVVDGSLRSTIAALSAFGSWHR